MSNDREHEAPLSDEERARIALEQLQQVHAVDLATEMMISLVSFGYQKLGLTEHTAPVRDLGDARLAIELLRALLEVVGAETSAAPIGDLRSTLAQLQLGYAQAVQLAGAAAEPPRAPAAAAAAAEPPRAAEAAAAPEAPAGAEDAPAPEPAKEAGAEDSATKRAAPRKPAAGKGTAKKPAAKKPPTPKPAAGKPAAKRTRKKPAVDG